MIRSKPATSMQKTYDDCFLICSTAVYFEGQGNESEALRSWRDARDQIYYHNAYRVPATYRPRTETERALQSSLRELELQCKERVDLLEALQKSREGDGHQNSSGPKVENGQYRGPPPPPAQPALPIFGEMSTMGQGSVAPIEQHSLPRPPPLSQTQTSLPILPPRPYPSNSRVPSAAQPPYQPQQQGPAPPEFPEKLEIPVQKKKSRTPSPEKRRPGMLRTLRGGRDSPRSSSASTATVKPRPPAASKAATQAWGIGVGPGGSRSVDHGREPPMAPPHTTNSGSSRTEGTDPSALGRQAARSSLDGPSGDSENMSVFGSAQPRTRESSGFMSRRKAVPSTSSTAAVVGPNRAEETITPASAAASALINDTSSNSAPKTSLNPIKLDNDPLSYRKEYPKPDYNRERIAAKARRPRTSYPVPHDIDATKANSRDPRMPRENRSAGSPASLKSDGELKRRARPRKAKGLVDATGPGSSGRDAQLSTEESSEWSSHSDTDPDEKVWRERSQAVLKNLPRGVDEAAAKQILNEIVIHGDEVHWADVAGLDIAKNALKETVVYPFLRPDLFMGLREPARGMLLFGPPGTGKTMLARAVATESRSTFFAISASSLTSKFLGESEKLVRALFVLAKALTPSIIFVDEIDSLLSTRSGSGEHEATRRIKTEFLIQWSDLQKAAAGREQSDKDKGGDPNRVLVLAATNMPWAIDEAARRRFVRRQYIPLPEDHVRKMQLETLLSHQKQELSERDLDRLVELTDGFSGSDITALAKDAAMGPLRSLGEKLLHMTMDEIRPIHLSDFEASLSTIRPSVSKQGLKEFEDWAREFGERGG